MQYFNEMLSAALEFGLLVNDLQIDGQVHRVATVGKPKSKNGWYIGYQENNSIVMGDWQTDRRMSWFPHHSTSLRAQQNISPEIERQKQLRASRSRFAIEQARSLYDLGKTVTCHPYLKSKHLQTYEGLRCYRGNLLVPLVCIADHKPQIMNVQTIHPNGQKRFIKYASTKRLCCPIGNINSSVDELYICEGFATALTLNTTTDEVVLAAMNAGNIFATACLARQRWPSAKIIIAGDDDWLTEQKIGNNIGKQKAIEAASAVGGFTCFPPFTIEQKKRNLTDWNDYLFNELKEGV